MKNLVLIFTIIAFSTSIFAQTNMLIRKTDGSLTTIDITDIDSISYVNTVAAPVTDYDGNVYDAVQIGSQIWMKQNLKTTHFADGTAINFISDDAIWGALADNNIDKAYSYYNNNLNDEAATYGALYSWAAAMNGASGSSANPSGVQGICPTGWHIPSSAEWTELTDYLGDSTVAGGKMKAISNLWSTNTGTDESGFSGLPNGYRLNDTGVSSSEGSLGLMWTSFDDGATMATIKYLNSGSEDVSNMSINKSLGAAVRCVKD